MNLVVKADLVVRTEYIGVHFENLFGGGPAGPATFHIPNVEYNAAP